ncbi:MAG TPA: AraC family transcriptional regulator [Roseiflexaceae bacterium]|nr:AraC family transcriptional regulator [Roseiflexaceae bacterium]
MFWRDPALADLELLRATYVTHTFAPHAHDGYAIGVIEAGAERFDYRGVAHTAPAGAIVLINPGEIHTGQAASAGGWSYRMLYPPAELVQRAAAELAGRPQPVPFFAEPVVWDAPLAAQLRTLHRALEAPADRLARESLFLQAMTQLVARHADAPPTLARTGEQRQAVARARRLLEEQHAEGVPLDELARHVGLSPFHLLRVFKREMGITPHAYLTHVRVRHARRLLAAGLPPADAALRTGFADQSHLTRAFKRIVGVPPGQYARQPTRV